MIDRRVVRNPLEGVPDEAWREFLRRMSVQGIRDVSASGGIGSFDLRPRRLGERGVMVDLERDSAGKWRGVLSPGYENLGVDATLQCKVFCESIEAYDQELRTMAWPEGSSRSGCLAILHCGGVGALAAWPRGAFATTTALFERTNNLF